jgi:alkylation response protein AidB-like acyl-CoA dehydrogenase
VAQQAVQLHGGMGMSDELGIGHGLKRITLLARLFGDPAFGIAAYARAA